MSGQCSPPLEGQSGNAQAPGTLAHRDSLHRLELPNRHRLRRPPKALSLRPSALEARDGALLQALAFELTQGRENCELEPAAGRAKIQTFLQRNEWDVQRLKSSSAARRCFKSRPIRSRAQHTTTWTLARRASRRSRSRPGRQSLPTGCLPVDIPRPAGELQLALREATKA